MWRRVADARWRAAKRRRSTWAPRAGARDGRAPTACEAALRYGGLWTDRLDAKDELDRRIEAGEPLQAGADKEKARVVDIYWYYGSALEALFAEPVLAFLSTVFDEPPLLYDVRNAALANAAGTSTFTHVRNAEGWSGLKFRPLPGDQPAETEEITVDVEVLDDVLPPDYVPALIKIDVEGAERQVLEGARRTLARHQPIVVFEHGSGSAEHYDTSPRDVYRLLVRAITVSSPDLITGIPHSVEA